MMKRPVSVLLVVCVSVEATRSSAAIDEQLQALQPHGTRKRSVVCTLD
jgi:hypothetical protein